jgi:aldose 1-epimerase
VSVVRDPAGRTLVLRHGAYRAEVVTVGAGLRSLTYDGLDLVAGYPAGAMSPDYRGWTLMPWPNRVGGGRYDFGGATHQLAITEVARGNALHGLVGWVPWTVQRSDDARASLRYPLPPQDGYPFALDLAVDYELGEDGLHVTLAATNAGHAAAPYGGGHHPYLTLGRRVDDLVLTLPAAGWCPMDERGLPSPAQPVDETPYDFRTPRQVGDTVLDHPFGGLTGRVVSLLDPEAGREVRLTLGDGFGWLHVFSGDTHGDAARTALAVEPMTCPPDAFRSGIDLVVLDPGATHRASFTITGS